MFHSTRKKLNFYSFKQLQLNSVVLLMLLLLLGMNSANSSNPRGRRMVTVRGRTLTWIAADAAVITVAVTVHARTLIERVQMLRRGRYPLLLLLLMVLLNLPDKVTVASALALAIHVAQLDLVGVVVEETLLLLLLLLKLLLLATAL